MTFLQPLFLFGLLAAAIPLVLHLLTLRRLRTVEFSTLAFLKELQKSRIRKIRLRQLLLLLLRMLIIILLVIAFSRPTLEGSVPSALGSATRTSAVLVVDDSYSMTGSDEHGELLKQARNAAERILDAFEDGDDVALLPLSRAGTPIDEITAHSRIPSVVRQEIGAIRTSALTKDLHAALRTSAGLLSQSVNPNKEVYVISDLQRSLFPLHSPGRESLFDGSTRFLLVPIGSGQGHNLSLSGLRFTSAIAEPGKPVEVEATVTHRGTSGTIPANVSVFLDGERMDQRVSDIVSGSSRSFTLTATPRRSGLLTGSVRLDGDELDFDNTLHFALRLPQEIRVLLIGSESDLKYLHLALATRTGSVTTVFRLTTVDPARMTAAGLNSYDVMFLAAGAPISPDLLTRLQAIVQSGAGLVVFPGTPSAVASSFGPALAAFGATAIDASNGASVASGSFLTFTSVDLAHPLVSGMFAAGGSRPSGDRARQAPESPEILRRISVRMPAGTAPVMTLSDGQVFLADLRVGAGRVLIFTSGMTREWSDLPVRGLFVPLMHRTVSYLAQEQAVRAIVRTGTEVAVPLSRTARGRLRIVMPDRQEIAATPTITPSGAAVSFRETRLPGVYSVMEDGAEIDRFAVNIAAEEGDTAPADETRERKLWEDIGVSPDRVRRLDPVVPIEISIRQARFGTEVWRWFLSAALVLAVVELLLSSYLRTSREQGGAS
ncbi:MAG: hypothetical protein A2X68_04125 [Ignavibacteria bacterium GWC2_56_12]|nr:MAG: hypothetical protein A2X68_04125 [Ignavibacteria bacterium GWC2_56_12]